MAQTLHSDVVYSEYANWNFVCGERVDQSAVKFRPGGGWTYNTQIRKEKGFVSS